MADLFPLGLSITTLVLLVLLYVRLHPRPQCFPKKNPRRVKLILTPATTLELYNRVLRGDDREAQVEVRRPARRLSFESHVVVQDEVGQHGFQLHGSEESSRAK